MLSEIVILGAGNVADSFIHSVKQTDIKIIQIYNRHIEKARELAMFSGSRFTDDITAVNPEADAYFFMLTDTAIIEISKQIKINKGILVHTAGSLSMEIFRDKSDKYGVFYPFQTFSKDYPVNFRDSPVCLEASDPETYNILDAFAAELGCKTYNINEEKRKFIHLSGVFACNFMNHCIYLGQKILEKADIEQELMKPLLEQSFKKVLDIGAEKAQTGPAKRMDKIIIGKHLELLKDDKLVSDIYELITESIYKTYNK